MVPTRLRRWCCSEYKHKTGPKKCTRILGVRVEESAGRAKNYTKCVMSKPAGRREVYPIRMWSDDNVWAFIRENNVPYCKLYDEGFTRLGCVGCPLASPENRRRELSRWPTYKRQWAQMAEFVITERHRRGLSPVPQSILAELSEAGIYEPARSEP